MILILPAGGMFSRPQALAAVLFLFFFIIPTDIMAHDVVVFFLPQDAQSRDSVKDCFRAEKKKGKITGHFSSLRSLLFSAFGLQL